MESIKRGRGQFDGWSKSSLKSLLEGCSWQWALQRLGGLQGGSSPHSAAGTGMHAAIEWHEKSRIDGVPIPSETDLILAAVEEARADSVNIPPTIEAFHGGADLAARWAAELTHTWYHSDVRDTIMGYTPIAVEPHLETGSVPSPHNLRGYIDWVGRDADGVATIVDYKSASDLRRWTDPSHHLIESSAYLWLAAASDLLEENEPVRMEWHIISRKGDGRVLAGPYLDKEISNFLFTRVREAQSVMDAASYRTNPSWNLCSPRWCNFYYGCQESGILSPDNIDFQTSSDTPPVPTSDPQG